MKRTGFNSLKLDPLVVALKLPGKWAARGILESLWIVTAAEAKIGNIGRWTNAQIAAGIDYREDADELIAALVKTGWLDEDSVHRLVVHHWDDHCDYTVARFVQKAGLTLLHEGDARGGAGARTEALAVAAPKPRHVSVSGGESPEVETILAAYRKKIKASTDDHSGPKAKRHVDKLLLEGWTVPTLLACIDNYADRCKRKETGTKFRKDAANFFGEDRVFETYTPKTYKADAEQAEESAPPKTLADRVAESQARADADVARLLGET